MLALSSALGVVAGHAPRLVPGAVAQLRDVVRGAVTGLARVGPERRAVDRTISGDSSSL